MNCPLNYTQKLFPFQSEVMRRRENELSIVQKERDLLKQNREEEAVATKRRLQNAINEHKAELEDIRRIKTK